MDTHDDFVAARRPSLVEEFGGGAAAEAAVDRALARCRRGWSRLEQTTDVESHVRELVAEELDRPRRRRLTLWALGALAVVAAGVAVVALRPAPPEVREEANRVPVPWYSAGELHLADVVVSLPGAGSFAPVDDGVVIEDAEGALRLVEEDGDVSDWDEAMPDSTGADLPSPYGDSAGYSRRLDVAVAPNGKVVHLMAVAADGPDAAEGYYRQSETARRLFVICTDEQCADVSQVMGPGDDVRLR